METLGQLLPLALLDTVSVATLAIPVWFLLAPRGPRIGNVLLYLALVGGGYLLLGVLLTGAVDRLRDPLGDVLASPAADTALGAAGAALILAGLWYGMRRRPASGLGRLTRWRESAVGEDASAGGVLTVALLAVALEVPTMFPYLAAMDILSGQGLTGAGAAPVLAVYCLAMVAPALLATLLFQASRGALRPVLDRVDTWLRDNAQENTAWLLAIAGFLLLSDSTLFQRFLDALRDAA
ncbi:GAP family protein [Nocardiopsis chromatogenes]|uniref:GAP family protein n=1 Tax=Nocardiopsis chromatogenes TaxID=280239 RepID=UPI00034C57B1|nr:GAP family protein [Nocardiopsis chromatogenes]